MKLQKPHPIRDLEIKETAQDIDDNFDAVWGALRELNSRLGVSEDDIAILEAAPDPVQKVILALDGTPGDDGMPGPRGATGITGATGALGPPGFDGADGADFWGVLAAASSEGEVTFTTTGNIDDLDFGNVPLIRMNNASLATLRGLRAGRAGQLVTIVSVGAGQVDLAHQNAGSVAANRLTNIATSAVTSLSAGTGLATFRYDNTTQSWRLIEHEQGAWITPSFSAGDYTANGAMTWTVASGDVALMAYYLKGRQLSVLFELNTTTTGGVASTALRRTVPGGFTIASGVRAFYRVINAGVTVTSPLGMAYAAAASTYIEFLRDGSGTANWTIGTDNVGILGSLFTDVQ